MTFQVITDKQTRDITVGNVHIEFAYKKQLFPHYYAFKKAISGTIQVSTPEMTVFDMLRYLSLSGQINHVATVLIELAMHMKPSILALLVRDGNVDIIAAQRLGYLLDVLELSVDLQPLEQALKGKKISRRLLVTQSDAPIIEYNERWHILVNEQVEPDEL